MRIVVTGGAGFIGSSLLWQFNQKGISDIIVVDHLGESEKWKNLAGKRFEDYMEKESFLEQLTAGRFGNTIDAIVHMGACSSTTESDASYLMQNNYRYTKKLAQWALALEKRFIYASSAATYGMGEHGYRDDDAVAPLLRPLNMYGYSKHLFDLWLLRNGFQSRCAGVKFFNVFGPNEFHKDDMRSMVLKGYEQIKATGKIKLFRSHREDYEDGEQKRDFIYIKDALSVIGYLLDHPGINGIFNLGTGSAATWNELAEAIYKALQLPADIEYIDMPIALREKYQYFTQADMTKLKQTGYDAQPTSLEDAVREYVSFLEKEAYL